MEHLRNILFFICLWDIGGQSHGGSKNGPKISCTVFWYEHRYGYCLDWCYCQSLTDVRSYPDCGEFCKHVCNCLSAACHKTVGCFPKSPDGECNPGYSRADCMETYGVKIWCKQICNCSEENDSYSGRCLIPSDNSNETKSTNSKINERFHLRVGAYVFVGITIFVIICIMIELLQCTGKRTDEHMI